MPNTFTLPKLLEVDELETHVHHPDLRIVQVCSPERFQEGHVPNAHHILPQALLRGTPPLMGATPSLAQIEQLITSLNITENTWVVALDDEGGGWAGRLLWTLEMVGFTRWSLLNGGLWAWSGAGHALAQPAQNTQQSQHPLTPQHEPAASTSTDVALWPCAWAPSTPAVDAETIKAHLDDPTWIVWDARSAPEYLGQRQTALRNGHIPGAQHYEWTQAMDKSRDLRIRDPEIILQELAHLGITPDKTVVTHCQSHHRSGFTWVLGRILGFENMLAYPGSWSEWGNSQDLPVSTQPGA